MQREKSVSLIGDDRSTHSRVTKCQIFDFAVFKASKVSLRLAEVTIPRMSKRTANSTTLEGQAFSKASGGAPKRENVAVDEMGEFEDAWEDEIESDEDVVDAEVNGDEDGTQLVHTIYCGSHEKHRDGCRRGVVSYRRIR